LPAENSLNPVFSYAKDKTVKKSKKKVKKTGRKKWCSNLELETF
jgi:hypothetical protein